MVCATIKLEEVGAGWDKMVGSGLPGAIPAAGEWAGAVGTSGRADPDGAVLDCRVEEEGCGCAGVVCWADGRPALEC